MEDKRRSRAGNKKTNDLRGNRTPNLRVWNPTRCHCAMKSFCGRLCHSAVLAERLRRTLKARVRKSVGSIPTDCIFFVSATPHQSAYSSVGRAGDCRWLQLISLGHWFDSGCADFFVHVVNDFMAQWQRVGFQTRRLGVRFPLRSFHFLFCRRWTDTVSEWLRSWF